VNTEQKTFQKYPFTGDACIRDDDWLGDSHQGHPGDFSGQRQGWKTPKRTPGGPLLLHV